MNPLTPTQANSNGENTPDIPTLTAEIDRLTQAVGFWNTAIIVLMVGVAAVATGLVIAQQKAFKTADALATATGQLAKLKEGIDDQKIAAAGLAASQADEKSTQLAKDNLNLQKQVAGLRWMRRVNKSEQPRRRKTWPN